MDVDLIMYLLLLAIAAARVAVLVAHDTILVHVRERLYLRWPPMDNQALGMYYQSMDRLGRSLPAGMKREWYMATELLTCTRCLTVYTAGALYALGELAGHGVAIDVAAPIAVMGAGAWIARRM